MKKFFMLLPLMCIALTMWGQNIDELMQKAQNGDAEAQYELGSAYNTGELGLTENKEEAFKWWLKAAEQGYAEAQYWIGLCYDMGFDVPVDNDKAEYWYLKAAKQGHIITCFSLGLFYEDTNKQEAVYWFKKYMDYCYANYGKEDETAAKHLRELGVYYHPGDKTSTASTGSSSSSSSTTSSSAASESAGEKLLYKGTYTQSQQGYCPETGSYTNAWGDGIQCEVEIYNSYIIVNGQKYDYDSASNGMRIYAGGNGFSGAYAATVYYYVNSQNFAMNYRTVGYGPLGTTTLIYQMEKGNTSFDIHQNNASTYSGGYSTGTGSGSGSQRSGNTTTRTYQKTCPLCHGSGKCNTCNGTHRYLNPLTNRYVTCPNCRPDGRCSSCGGTGKKP